MKEIAKTFLAVPHTAPWIHDESASALVNFVYEGGIWDARAREKYPAIRQKSSQEWSMDEVFAYLTFIAVVDRITRAASTATLRTVPSLHCCTAIWSLWR